MSSLSAQETKDLCDKRLIELRPSDGQVQRIASDQYLLAANGVQFPELDHEQLRAAVIGLSKVLLHPGLNAVQSVDHALCWAWCAEMLLSPRPNLHGHIPYFDQSEHELQTAMGLCANALLARTTTPQGGFGHHAEMLVFGATSISSFLAFPVLEGIVRKHCSAYVNMDGTVILAFEGTPPRKRFCRPGQACSNLEDLLWLLRHHVASPSLQQDMDELGAHLVGVGPTSNQFDLLFSWRNDVLYRAANFTTVAGTVLSTAQIIALSRLQSGFEARRDIVRRGVEREMQHGWPRSPWSWYPPDW